jgi:hypothetical protein
VVKLTGDQTVAGVKTFSSIPVLPASDPTTDNQAVRKAYVDNAIPDSEVEASDTVRDSANTERSHNTTTYTKKKDITFNEVSGIIRVYFEAKQADNVGNSYARIYVNGSAVGTEREVAYGDYSPNGLFTEDIAVNTGDEVQLYIKLGTHTTAVYCQSFQLKYDKILSVTPGTVNND